MESYEGCVLPRGINHDCHRDRETLKRNRVEGNDYEFDFGYAETILSSHKEYGFNSHIDYY